MSFTGMKYQYEETTLLYGDVRVSSEGRLEFQSFSVIVFIKGFDHDVTKALAPNVLESFKEDFERYMRESYWDSLREQPDDNGDDHAA